MDILMICIHRYEQFAGSRSSLISSPTLMQLASLTPDKFNLTVFDNPISIDFNKDYDLVAISTVTTFINYGYRIADEFRRRGSKVILGGYHASALPNEAKQHADSVVIGEADNTWPQLLIDFEKGKLKPFYIQDKPVDLNTLPLPKRDIYSKKSNITTIQFSRGCPIGCKFCAIVHMPLQNNFRVRPIKKIVEELNTISQKYLWICDSTLTINVENTKKIFKELKEFDKKLLHCNGNANILARDDELLKLASEAGCLEWLIGFESISQASIDSIGKTTNKVEEYKNAIEKIHDHGMLVRGEFIFGFDYDTIDIFGKTLDAIQNIEVDKPGLNIITPFPGTQLFNKLDGEGRILTKDWSKYNMWDVVFQPKNMTPEELRNGAYNLSDKIYSTSNTIKRLLKTSKLGFYPLKEAARKNIFFWSNHLLSDTRIN